MKREQKKERDKFNQPSGKGRLNRSNLNAILLVALLVVAIFWILIFDPKLSMGGDSAQYLALGKSIADRFEYRNLVYIHQKPEVSIPWGFPFLLAIVMWIWGLGSFIPFKILVFLIGLASVWVIMRIWQREFPSSPMPALLAIVVFGLNYNIAEFSHWVLTEFPFLLTVAITVFFVDYLWMQNEGKFWVLFLVFSCTFCAVMFRPAGAPLPIALLVTILMRRKWKWVFPYFLSGAVIVLPWVIRLILIRDEGGIPGYIYLINFLQNYPGGSGESLALSDYVNRVVFNSKTHILTHLPLLFFPSLSESNPVLKGIVGVLLFCFCLAEFWFALRNKKLIAYFIFIYSAMLMVYNPIACVIRYLVPAVPVLIVMFFRGVRVVTDLVKRHIVYKWCVAMFVVLMTLSGLVDFVPRAKQNIRDLSGYFSGDRFAGLHPVYVRFIEANEWLRGNASPNAGVISRKPSLTWIFSGHPAKNYLLLSPDEVMSDIDTSGAEYVIVDRLSSTTPAFLVPAIQKFTHRFQVVYRTGEPTNYVLRILPKEPGIPPDSVIREP